MRWLDDITDLMDVSLETAQSRTLVSSRISQPRANLSGWGAGHQLWLERRWRRALTGQRPGWRRGPGPSGRRLLPTPCPQPSRQIPGFTTGEGGFSATETLSSTL